MTIDNAALDAQILDNDEKTEIARLAALNPLQYSRERTTVADALGVAVGALDQAVKEHQRSKKTDTDSQLPHWAVEPWKDPVATASLLDAIVAVFNRSVVLPKHAAEAMALWCLHAWGFDAWDLSPFLMLASPTKRCGKTTALILLNWLTPRSVVAGDVSPTSIFRYIEEQRPTLLIDEADTFLKVSDEIRGILNAGHTKATAHAIRNIEVGGQHVPKMFSTWAPKIIAGIGRFAGTLEDRSVIVPMQRKPKGARVQRCRHRDSAELIELRQKALRWATDNLPALHTAAPKLPDALNDRAADNCPRDRLRHWHCAWLRHAWDYRLRGPVRLRRHRNGVQCGLSALR
jgi:putative DNA primase/helicase